MALLFGLAFFNAANTRSVFKVFEKTGTWPANKGFFTDDDFLQDETTNIPVST